MRRLGWAWLCAAAALTVLLARAYDQAARRHVSRPAAGTPNAPFEAGSWLDVQRFAIYAAERLTTPAPDSAARSQSFLGLRRLAAALDEIASHRMIREDSLRMDIAALRSGVEGLDVTTRSTPAPLAARRVIDRAVAAAARLQRIRFPGAHPQLRAMREAAWRVDPTRSLRYQQDQLDAFFLRALELMQAMGAPVPPIPFGVGTNGEA